jgi:hypothetical protein
VKTFIRNSKENIPVRHYKNGHYWPTHMLHHSEIAAHTLQPAWGSVVVKALRYYSEGLGIDPQWCRWEFFLKLLMEPCALGSTQPLKMSTRILLGVKTARAQGWPYHLHSAETRENPGALTSWISKGRLRLVVGKLYPLPFNPPMGH